MSSGRGGSCDRDPFLATTSSAYAYQAKPSDARRRLRSGRLRVDEAKALLTLPEIAAFEVGFKGRG